MKRLILLYFSLSSLCLHAQDYNIFRSLDIDSISTVEDFQSTTDNYLFLTTNNEIITTNKLGQSLQTNSTSEFNEPIQDIVSINKDDTEEVRNTMGLFVESRVPGSPFEDAILLAFGDEEMFTCLYNLETDSLKRYSWSNKIVSVDNNSDIFPFNFLIGEPAGIHIQGDKLYYLCKTINDASGILVTFDLNSKRRLTLERIPVFAPAGLAIEPNGTLVTYSNQSKQLLFLTK